MRAIASALLASIVLVAGSPVEAGRRPWIFAEDDTLVPDGDVEIESWIGWIDRAAGHAGQWHWWLGPYWSPVENLEVAALTVVAMPYDPPTANTGAQLWFEHLSLRWRVIERTFGALFLKAEGRIAFADLPFQISPSVAWAKHVGRFGFAASLGYAYGFEGPKTNESYQWLVYRAAASVDVVRGEIAPVFQVGAELYAQQVIAGLNDLSGNGQSSLLVGPTLAVARGRLWLTLGALAGATQGGPVVMVRGLVGLAL